LYLIDRGYIEYALYQAILNARSSFVARLRGNAVFQVVETRPLSAEARAAGVESDQVVWLGGQKAGVQLKTPVRILKVHVKNPPAHGLKPRGARVNGKVKTIRTSQEEFDLWLVTDRLDLPAETVALLYRYRWQIEIFFRWFKCVLGCRHLLAHSPNGIRLQVYAALIASLLIVLWTGKKPNKYALQMVSLYLQGWADLDELTAFLTRLKTNA
jgi:IS4 transposase